ncbi:hypothetical protein HK405_004753, partial [Cladochytrium tenue]
ALARFLPAGRRVQQAGVAQAAAADDAESAPLIGESDDDGAAPSPPQLSRPAQSQGHGARRPHHFSVLSGVQGHLEPGQVMAIMGGSGAGKTTLLDILARRNKAGTVLGEVLVNGSPMGDKEFKSIIGYVDQEDTLMDTLTVHETILYSALLRLPRSMSYAAKRRRVDQTLRELGIAHIANRRIGSTGARGISGGEKRRVSIACELVTSPSILFLDEPTSGLDSYNAYNVVECLVSLARDYRRTVVLTIHQPRSNIYALFDQLVLLSRGRPVYSGPAQEPAIRHFAAMGYPCPVGYNLADFLVDLTMQKHESYTDRPESAASSGAPSEVVFANHLDDDEDDEVGGGSGTLAVVGSPSRFAFSSSAAATTQPAVGAGDPLSSARLILLHDDDDDDDEVGVDDPWRFPTAATISAPLPAEFAANHWTSESPEPPRSPPQQMQPQPPQPQPRPQPHPHEPAPNATNHRARGPATASPRTRGGGGIGSGGGGNLVEALAAGYLASPVAELVQTEIAAAQRAGAATAAAAASGGRGAFGALRRAASFASTTTTTTAPGNAASSLHGDQRASALTQLAILSERAAKNLYRRPGLLMAHWLVGVVAGLAVGGVFWGVRDDLGGFQNRLGLFFFVCSLFGFGCLTSMQAFTSERAIFIRERANRYYQPATYFATKVLFDAVPLRVVPPIILTLICYNMVGLRSETVQEPLRFTLVLVLFNLCASAGSMLLALVFGGGGGSGSGGGGAGLATLAGTLAMLWQMLFGGLLVNSVSVPAAFRWAQDGAFFRAAVEALAVNEVYGLQLYETKFGLQIDVPGAVVLQTFGFDHRAFWADVRQLAVAYAVLVVAAFAWLQLAVRERR